MLIYVIYIGFSKPKTPRCEQSDHFSLFSQGGRANHRVPAGGMGWYIYRILGRREQEDERFGIGRTAVIDEIGWR